LSGGDAAMATRILVQIKKEIPLVKEELRSDKSLANVSALKHLLHSMIATFSPLGNNHKMVKAIDSARKKIEEPGYPLQAVASNCLNAMEGLEADIDERIKMLEIT
jgi:hypothetical protein